MLDTLIHLLIILFSNLKIILTLFMTIDIFKIKYIYFISFIKRNA
jgi:hypothetical protein